MYVIICAILLLRPPKQKMHSKDTLHTPPPKKDTLFAHWDYLLISMLVGGIWSVLLFLLLIVVIYTMAINEIIDQNYGFIFWAIFFVPLVLVLGAVYGALSGMWIAYRTKKATATNQQISFFKLVLMSSTVVFVVNALLLCIITKQMPFAIVQEMWQEFSHAYQDCRRYATFCNDFWESFSPVLLFFVLPILVGFCMQALGGYQAFKKRLID